MSVLSAACLLFVLAGVGVLKMVLIVVVGAVVGAITVQVVLLVLLLHLACMSCPCHSFVVLTLSLVVCPTILRETRTK